MAQNPYRGRNFDDFLAEEGILEEVTLRAQKRLLAEGIPIPIPDAAEVEALARELHAGGVAYEGVVWGWPVHYEPEWREESAEFQIPDGQGGWRTEIRPFFSPASFTIGQNGFWFYSLLWENGREAPQWCMWKEGE
ncbi:MAG: hypothetical protein OT477_23145 [Chloroflexi bacterium]|nr:hypothetical protein [Chloroflexota bacterium]